MKMRQAKTNYGRIIDNLNDRIINTTINDLNETVQRERQRRLSEFSTQALEKELLNRQNCQFGRLTCTGTAEEWIIKHKDQTCFNCKQDILSLLKSKKTFALIISIRLVVGFFLLLII